ncbi:MAG: hypothetical protein FJZ79_03310 [Chlorobi bacterium]|nr:hypothetical protein [Chlorobiota bacterium]
MEEEKSIRKAVGSDASAIASILQKTGCFPDFSERKHAEERRKDSVSAWRHESGDIRRFGLRCSTR